MNPTATTSPPWWRRWRWPLAIAVVLAVITLVMAASREQPSSAAGDAVTTIAGQKVNVPDGKPAALLFFSVGCGSCADSVKSMAAAADQTRGTADVLAIDMDPGESSQEVSRFLDAIGYPKLPVAIDRSAALTKRFNVTTLSTVVVIDASGSVTYRATEPSVHQIVTALDKAAHS